MCTDIQMPTSLNCRSICTCTCQTFLHCRSYARAHARLPPLPLLCTCICPPSSIAAPMHVHMPTFLRNCMCAHMHVHMLPPLPYVRYIGHHLLGVLLGHGNLQPASSVGTLSYRRARSHLRGTWEKNRAHKAIGRHREGDGKHIA